MSLRIHKCVETIYGISGLKTDKEIVHPPVKMETKCVVGVSLIPTILLQGEGRDPGK